MQQNNYEHIVLKRRDILISHQCVLAHYKQLSVSTRWSHFGYFSYAQRTL